MIDFKEPPSCLLLADRKLSYSITTIRIAIAEGDLPNIPILNIGFVSNVVYNKFILGIISYLSSSKRLEVTSRILEEL